MPTGDYRSIRWDARWSSLTPVKSGPKPTEPAMPCVPFGSIVLEPRSREVDQAGELGSSRRRRRDAREARNRRKPVAIVGPSVLSVENRGKSPHRGVERRHARRAPDLKMRRK